MIYFFKVMVCYKEKQVDLSVLAQSPASLAIVCKSLTSDQKKSHLFIGKKATSDSLYLPACSFLEECCLQWNVVEGRKTSFYTVSVVVIIRRNPPPTVEAAAFVAVSVLCLPSSFDQKIRLEGPTFSTFFLATLVKQGGMAGPTYGPLFWFLKCFYLMTVVTCPYVS